jgi:hypothetical protein
MAKTQSQTDQSKSGVKYPLLVYKYGTRRFRPAGLLFILTGLALQIPRILPQFRFDRVPLLNLALNYEQLGIIGFASIGIGFFLYVGSIIAERQAYVQCLPDFLLINTMFHRVYTSYARINAVQPVQVGKSFDIKNVKGTVKKESIKKLVAEPAVEVKLTEFPVDEKVLRRRFSQFLFSTRETGYILVVPKPTALSLELNTYTQRSLDKRDADQQRYLDPIERLKYQNQSQY